MKKIVQITTPGKYQHCLGFVDGTDIILGRMGREEIVSLNTSGLQLDERLDLDKMLEELVDEMGGEEVVSDLGIDFVMDTIEQQNRPINAELLLCLNIDFKNVGHLSIFQEIYKRSGSKETLSDTSLDEFIALGLEEKWIKFNKVAQPEVLPNATRIKKKGYKKNGRKKR